MKLKNRRLNHSKKSTERVLAFVYEELMFMIQNKGKGDSWSDCTAEKTPYIPGIYGYEGKMGGKGISIEIHLISKGYHEYRLFTHTLTYCEAFVNELELKRCIERTKIFLK